MLMLKHLRGLGLNSALSTALCVGLALSAAACATLPPVGVEKEGKPADLDALKAVGGKAAGTIVWTSSRGGLPHLYTMRTDGSDVKELTHGEQTDWYPRFSPEGARVLFCRSRDDGFVRQSAASDAGTWDLYTINVDGSALTKVVDDGCWGSWIGPDQILFVRGSKIMRADLRGGDEAEKRVTDLARHPIFDGGIGQGPELSPDGQTIALTLAGGHRQTGLWNIKKKTWTVVGSGAQVTWAPGGGAVLWVNAAGKDGVEIARRKVEGDQPAEDAAPEVLVDVPGKRSREAFPRLSNDGKWLVFGAAIHGLEQDLEDYEIYLWEVGTPLESAARETFHTANDRWPDVFVGPPGQPPALDTGAKSDDEGADEPEGAAQKTEQKTEGGEEHGPAGDSQEATPKADETTPAETDEKKTDTATGTANDGEAETPSPAAIKPRAKSKKKHH
jgi:WD40-like Beta Propeller Repeat